MIKQSTHGWYDSHSPWLILFLFVGLAENVVVAHVTDYDECSDTTPCLNGGTCVPEFSTSAVAARSVCDCSRAKNVTEQIRFVGAFCDVAVAYPDDYCDDGGGITQDNNDSDLFCVHGGVCRRPVDPDFSTKPCDCPAEYQGIHCEFWHAHASLQDVVTGHHHEELVRRPREVSPVVTLVLLIALSLLVLVLVRFEFRRRRRLEEEINAAMEDHDHHPADMDHRNDKDLSPAPMSIEEEER